MRHRSVPRTVWVLAITLLASAVWGVPSQGQPPVRIDVGSEADFAAFLSERQSLLDGGRQGSARAQPGPKAVAEPSIQFILPYYRVDRERPFGETTLFALRNVDSESTVVRANFYSPGSTLLARRDYQLDPREVATVNLRDIPNLRTGYVFMTSLGGGMLAGDYFRIDPDQNFATGGLLVETEPDGGFLCRLWDIRLIKGGGFSGGTEFELWIRNAPGFQSDDPVAVRLAYFDEAGEPAGMLLIRSSANAFTVNVDFPGQIDFGAVEILFTPESGGGLVSGMYSAEERYSIGVKGTCRIP